MMAPSMPSLEDWAVVSLGSNQGDSTGIIEAAMVSLQALSCEPILKSSLWKSEPVDCPPSSPWFVNAIVVLRPKPGESPESLLRQLKGLEDKAGRQPKRVPNEPRPLDLDLIAFGREIRSIPGLVLPHPRAHLRRFVLEPLCEVAPGLVLPGQSIAVKELLGQLGDSQGMIRIG